MSLTTIKYIIKPDGNVEEEVQGGLDHDCQRITMLIDDKLGEVISHDHLESFFVTDSNPTEANIQNLEDEDWRGCCTSWECAV